LFLAAFATISIAEGGFVSVMTTRYDIPNNSKLNSCATCHTSVPNLNAYGVQLRDAGAGSNLLNAFAVTDTMDADSDHVDNETELRGGSWPADPNDIAPVEATTWGRVKALFNK
jgi:hypothetical protein